MRSNFKFIHARFCNEIYVIFDNLILTLDGHFDLQARGRKRDVIITKSLKMDFKAS